MYATILLALDGSDDSLAGAQHALEISAAVKAAILAVHIYDTKIHATRFQQMEPGLPAAYRKDETLTKLRTAHDTLMTDGFRSLSFGYMKQFMAQAQERHIPVQEIALASRNYVGILTLAKERKADLIILGATGLGAQHDGMIGSTANRLLRMAPSDILIARKRKKTAKGVILAGADGSPYSLLAVDKAAWMAQNLKRRFHIASVYDVAFHHNVFKTMIHSLSKECQQQVGLDRQEQIHEQLIDESLKTLYHGFLMQAVAKASLNGSEPVPKLLCGKAYRALSSYAEKIDADLVVLGRYGNNREDISDLGSHAEAVVRKSKHSVLISGGVESAGTYCPVKSGNGNTGN